MPPGLYYQKLGKTPQGKKLALYTPKPHTAASKVQAAFRSRSAAKKVAAVKTIANKQINRKKETHIKVLDEPRTAYNNIASVTADLRPVLPHIYQEGQDAATPGTKQSGDIESREGSKVHLRSLHIKGIVTVPTDDSPTSNDRALLALRLLCLSSDKYKTFSAFQGNWQNGDGLRNVLLKKGSSSIPFDGTLGTLWLPVNTNAFTVHEDRTFYIDRGNIINSGVVSVNTSAYFPSALSYKPFSLSLRVKNKALHYGAPTASQPVNYGPGVILMYAYVNGAAAAASTVPFMQFQTTTKWKDE